MPKNTGFQRPTSDDTPLLSMDLFENAGFSDDAPLAERLRPKDLNSLLGQDQILNENKTLIEKLRKGSLQNLILWGPPGSGKTSFATALMNEIDARVFSENAIDLGAKRIRELGEDSKRLLYEQQKKTLIFIDEIHRLNRGQQDVLLPFIEKGFFYLIGATTENPSYQLNSALTSRSRLLVFESHTEESLQKILDLALEKDDLSSKDLLSQEALEILLSSSHGDARRLLNNAEEILALYKNKVEPTDLFPLTVEELQKLFQTTGLRFDKKGDQHYDVISAFIKSIRGSDPDAAVYYLARMLEGGEDPLFIARRLVISASEDVGNGDPQALNIAVSGLKAVELVGMPEAAINLSQVTTYLCSAPKSNRSYMAIKKAQKEVKQSGPLPVPKHLRSSKTDLMKNLGYGKGYKYSHDYPKGWSDQTYLPEKIENKTFYEPSERGFEKRITEYLKWLKS